MSRYFDSDSLRLVEKVGLLSADHLVAVDDSPLLENFINKWHFDSKYFEKLSGPTGRFSYLSRSLDISARVAVGEDAQHNQNFIDYWLLDTSSKMHGLLHLSNLQGALCPHAT